MHRNFTFTASDVIGDRNVRYVIMTGTLFNTPMVLANVYALNYDDEGFLLDLCHPSQTLTLII